MNSTNSTNKSFFIKKTKKVEKIKLIIESDSEEK